MSAEKQSADEEITKVESFGPATEKTLDGILGWVQKKKIEAEDPKTNTTKASPWSWVVGTAVAVLIFFALAFLAWCAWSKGREIAKLKHELDLKKEEEEKAKINAEMEQNKKHRKQLESKAISIESEINRLINDLEGLEKDRKLAHSMIDEVTSWEDIDKIIENRKSLEEGKDFGDVE